MAAPAQDMVDFSGPIDIQANEQDFADEQVIARGNVRVTYKDSVILAPQATLIRGPSGGPQKAIFTGHPRLTQGANVIIADTLTFEVVAQKVIAEGNAHSEVVGQQGAPEGGGNAPAKPAEKIITDSDRQEYDKAQDKFEALGNVRVRHGEIKVTSDKLQIVYGPNKKPETAIFTGNVTATQGQNRTSADVITYNLTTKRLQASGRVKSQVIQKAETLKNQGLPVTSPQTPAWAPDAAVAAVPPAEEPVIITSDAQDYSPDTGRLSAEGNVRVYYQDTVGIGPKVVLVRNEEGKAERVIFIGRSAVSQPGRKWIADRITVTVADKKVLAEGNTKALILKPGSAPALNGERLAGRAKSISSSKIEAAQ